MCDRYREFFLSPIELHGIGMSKKKNGTCVAIGKQSGKSWNSEDKEDEDEDKDR